VLQFAFLTLIAEVIYPGYNVSRNHLSDLGVGPEPSGTIFTIGIIICGACIIIAAFLIWILRRDMIFSVFLALAGIGSIGAGLFNETDHLPLHIVSASLAFGFGGFAAITSFRLSKPAFSYVSIILGFMTLTAFVLLETHNHLGLGEGGMERMVAYPIIFWAIGFGAYLMHPEERRTAR
jgi:hypothetical membrane protein